MKYSQYKFKFYINANHAIYLNGVLGKNHPHTWEITIDTIKVRDDFIQFDIIENKVEAFFLTFQDADVNTIEPFNVINPTLENLCDYFKTMLSRILGGNGWLLTKIEMSETPSRSYIIDRADEIEKIIKGEMLADNSNLKIDSEAEKIANKILS